MKKLVAVLALMALCLALTSTTGCVNMATGNTHWWAGLSTNGVGFAERSVVPGTNGVSTTNSYAFKVTVPFNISAALQTLFMAEF